MRPITADTRLHAGDVVYHPAFGFALVEGAPPDGLGPVALRWERPGPNHPTQVSPAGLHDAYRRCDPRGLCARSVETPDAARALCTSEPLVALGLLLLDLGGRQRKEDVRDWLVERRLVGDGRFDDWWSAVLALARADGRFVVHRDGVRLAEPVGYDELLPSRPTALPGPGSLPGTNALGFAIRLARALAEVHAQKNVLPGGREAVSVSGAQVRLRGRARLAEDDPRDDVRTAMRLVLEQVLGPLPSAADLPDAELPPLVGTLAPSVPVELLAVAQRAMATRREERPEDGLALLHELVVANAVHELRQSAPLVRDAAWHVGFDSHIGTVKSLQSQVNQDCFVVAGDPTLLVAAVADGISLSTAGSGDLASALFARSLRAHWRDHVSGLLDANPARVHNFLADALRRANTNVCEAALRLAGGDLERYIPMGTTALVTVMRGNRVHLVGLGDSRAYLVGRFGCGVASADLNLESMRLGEAVAGREVEWDEPRHSLTSYIGHFTLDGRVELPPVVTRTFTLLPGEWLILATDGLSDFAAGDDAETAALIAKVVAESDPSAGPTPQAMTIARTLVGLALEGGGGDNVTVLALTIGAADATDSPSVPVPSLD